MLCPYKHTKLAVTTKGSITCLQCQKVFSPNNLMHCLVTAQLIVFKQMKDKDIWKDFENNEDARYIRDQLGKLHNALEDLEL